ncbi:MAG: ABC transporter substrate-binding protein, partial [Oscillospiraceae bacterium]
MNKKKLFKICGLIAILLVGGVFSACSSAGAISTYTIPLTEMPKNLDAQVATSPQEILVLTNIYDGLYDFVGGEAVPNLAKSCAVSQDGLEYTFILKETSSFYAKGVPAVPVKAKDFIFSFKRIQDPNTHSPYYDEFKNIVEMEAPDDYTLKIKLARRDGNFLDKLCIPAASPCNEEFFKSTQGAYGLGVKNIMSNGPFAVNYLADDDSYATLVRVVDNKNAIARIRLSLNDGETTPEKMFKEDRISGFFAQGKLSENLECKKESFMGTNVNLIFNMEKPEYKNENIRKALAYYAFGMENSGANLAAVKQSYSAFTDTLSFSNKGINEQITLKKPDYLGQNPKNICQEGLGELGQTKLTGTKVLLPSDSPYTVIFENINQLWQKELGQFFSLELLPQ